MSYEPSKEILDKYADLLINFGLNTGKGIKEGEIIELNVPECAKPLLVSLRNSVLKAGGHCIINYQPDDIAREFYELANQKQLEFFPSDYHKGLINQVDHILHVIAETNKHELERIDPKKLMIKREVTKPYMDWRDEKEYKGELTWTLGLYGTEAMAMEAGMSLEDYWGEIIRACYLDFDNPVEKWREIQKEVWSVRDKLNSLKIEKLRIKADGTDLNIGLGKDRKWVGCDGRNIPSYEIFVSPDWRKTEGYISFNEPLYRYGNLIKDVYLEFKGGKVVEVRADQGVEVLKEMISVENADKIGEFSLTDARISRVKRFMGETLYEENKGGDFGNTHIALGSSYKDCYSGDPGKVSKEEWENLGYNDSVIHTDIISTINREVIATLENGEEKVIYRDGKFIV